MAATMAEMKVLGASMGSSIRSNLSKVSDGMESYFEKRQQEKKTLNVEVHSFVPQLQAMYTRGQILPRHGVTSSQTPIITATDRAVTQIQSLTTAPLTL